MKLKKTRESIFKKYSEYSTLTLSTCRGTLTGMIARDEEKSYKVKLDEIDEEIRQLESQIS
ncbi:hypothetical protein HY967_00130 [Candidatus Jorgensenbacteria bacterium]|nr:hypothetical protein [Candidatus Jorgensenbacteria bacterium]